MLVSGGRYLGDSNHPSSSSSNPRVREMCCCLPPRAGRTALLPLGKIPLQMSVCTQLRLGSCLSLSQRVHTQSPRGMPKMTWVNFGRYRNFRLAGLLRLSQDELYQGSYLKHGIMPEDSVAFLHNSLLSTGAACQQLSVLQATGRPSLERNLPTCFILTS